MYKGKWDASVGEVLMCMRETHNTQDPLLLKRARLLLGTYHEKYQECALFFTLRWRD